CALPWPRWPVPAEASPLRRPPDPRLLPPREPARSPAQQRSLPQRLRPATRRRCQTFLRRPWMRCGRSPLGSSTASSSGGVWRRYQSRAGRSAMSPSGNRHRGLSQPSASPSQAAPADTWLRLIPMALAAIRSSRPSPRVAFEFASSASLAFGPFAAGFGAALGARFVEDVGDIALDRGEAQAKRVGDLLIGFACRDQRQYLLLAWAEVLIRVWMPGHPGPLPPPQWGERNTGQHKARQTAPSSSRRKFPLNSSSSTQRD